MARCEPLIGKRVKATEICEIDDDEDESTDFESEITYIMDLHLEEEKDENVLESPKSEARESGVIDIRDIPELFINESPESCVENNFSQAVVKIERGENLEEHPNLVPVEMTKNTSLNSSILPEASIPARCSWEGEHCFKVKVDCPKSTKRTESHSVYWESRNKLYVSKDYPFKVLVSAVNVPAAAVIRVHAAFCLSEDAYQIVRRCPTHAQQDYVKGNPAYEHVIHCLSEAACYDKNSTGRLTVSVPYWKPQNGETCSMYLFKLTCFNSCVGGINRRPFVMVFNLENNGVSVGRQIIEARVCACPTRDFHTDMGRTRSKKNVENNKDVPSSNSVETSKKYIISVKDPELYNFLKRMQSFYESSAYVNQLMNADV